MRLVAWCVAMGFAGFAAGMLTPGLIVVGVVLLAAGGGYALARRP